MKEYFALGLMSGTSLDGLDLCHVRYTYTGQWQFEILNAETTPYSQGWQNQLRTSIHLSADDLFQLNTDYGFYLAEQAKAFISKNQIQHLDIISSHGHTVYHQPSRRFTVQIGDGRAIKTTTGIPVAYDFRSQDVLLGGNGAPLVPIGDRLLFSQYDACLNLGGFSNISFERQGRRMAFDIGPVNIVLNELAAEFGQAYDQDGRLAANGSFCEDLFEKLNALDFYRQPSPKSLGVEWVKMEVFPLLEGYRPHESITTFTRHAAFQIATVFNEFKIKNVLVTGGGAFNKELLSILRSYSDTEIIVPDQTIVEYKEAMIFALMGVLRLRNDINVLSSATGSRGDHCSGLLV